MKSSPFSTLLVLTIDCPNLQRPDTTSIFNKETLEQQTNKATPQFEVLSLHKQTSSWKSVDAHPPQSHSFKHNFGF